MDVQTMAIYFFQGVLQIRCTWHDPSSIIPSLNRASDSMRLGIPRISRWFDFIWNVWSLLLHDIDWCCMFPGWLNVRLIYYMLLPSSSLSISSTDQLQEWIIHRSPNCKGQLYNESVHWCFIRLDSFTVLFPCNQCFCFFLSILLLKVFQKMSLFYRKKTREMCCFKMDMFGKRPWTCKDVEVASPATISRNGMVGESQLKLRQRGVLGGWNGAGSAGKESTGLQLATVLYS